VVDALDLQEIERLADIFRRPLFAGMGDRMEAEPAGAGEDALELGRRMALLRGIQPDADEAPAPGPSCPRGPAKVLRGSR